MTFAEIEQLMDVVPGTQVVDCFEALTTLVEHYEAGHEPIVPPDPIKSAEILYG